MHMLIRILVTAEDKDSALEKGKEVGDRLTEGPNHLSDFDYYKSLDHEPGELGIAGADRWGHDIPAVAKVDSKEGQELVEEGWDSTQKWFQKGIEKARLVMEHLSDDEIREEEFDKLPEEVQQEVGSPYEIRYCFRQVAGLNPCYNYLFNRHGEPIRNKTELENLRSSVDEDDAVDLWVIPLDVHH